MFVKEYFLLTVRRKCSRIFKLMVHLRDRFVLEEDEIQQEVQFKGECIVSDATSHVNKSYPFPNL